MNTEYVLRMLGLDICADTLIGNEIIQGISGGQKKRVTAGEMIVSSKTVIPWPRCQGLRGHVMSCLLKSAGGAFSRRKRRAEAQVPQRCGAALPRVLLNVGVKK